jgi:hypothetical protein
MSAVTKVLIVFVLLLSGIFAGSQILLFQRRENFADLYAKSQENLKTTRQELDTAKNDARDWRQRHDAIKASLDNEVTVLKQQVLTQTDNARVQGQRLDATMLNVTELTKTVQAQAADVKAKDDAIVQLRTAVGDREKQVQAGLAKIDELDKTLKQKDAQIGSLDNQLLELKKKHEELARTEQRFEAIVADFVRRGFSITQLEVPPINGYVVGVDTEQSVAVINQGSKAGVKPATQFTVYRDSALVGTLEIQDVYAEMAAGRVIRLADAMQVQIGDSATTEVR